jgi:hypothetical protein
LGGEGRKKKGKGGGEADRRGPGVSVAGKKEKGEEKRWAGAGRLDGPLGPSGLKGEPAMFCFFFFFFFSFIFKPFFISNSIQTFSNFFSIIL